MILPWSQLENYYGQGLVAPYRDNFVYAEQTTYALLCYGQGDQREVSQFASTASQHAERNMLISNLWKNRIEKWKPGDPKIVVTLAINRTSCFGCSFCLAEALNDLRRRWGGELGGNRFIIAARGVYEDAAMDTCTTIQDLRLLRDAGWEQHVLYTPQPGTPYNPTLAGLPPVGRQLYQALQRGFSTPDPVIL